METTDTAKRNSCQDSQPAALSSAMRSAEFVEDDLGKAAYLHAIGDCFLGLHNLGRGHFGFGFQDDRGTAAQVAASYFQAQVSPHQLVESLRFLKAVLFVEKRHSREYENDPNDTIRFTSAR